MDFHAVEANLRQSFRTLAAGRERADVAELPGVTIASLGVKFQMFNAAFLNQPVVSLADLERLLSLTSARFRTQYLSWAFWFCEDWLAMPVRRRLSQTCAEFDLRLASELPGMSLRELSVPKRRLPGLAFERVTSRGAAEAFRNVGSVCFHVPRSWFAEVFDDDLWELRPEFACWIASLNGEPVATAASVVAGGAIGLYNVATLPARRGEGIAEALTRHVVEAARREAGPLPLILQSTSLGYRMYEKLGFREVTRILVYSFNG